jgi:hypothetical protein
MFVPSTSAFDAAVVDQSAKAIGSPFHCFFRGFRYSEPVDRIAAAQDRMWKLRRELSVEIPCVGCRHLRWGNCRHPAVQAYESDPVSGQITAIPLPAKMARAEDGPCGPEGALFDPQADWTAAMFGVVHGLRMSVVILGGLFFVGFWLWELLGR